MIRASAGHVLKLLVKPNQGSKPIVTFASNHGWAEPVKKISILSSDHAATQPPAPDNKDYDR